MNDLKGIIEDCNKSDLVSDKVIKKIIEIIGQEEWQDLHDENSDICTTMGELIITLKGIVDLEKENADLKSEKGCETCTKFDEVQLTKAKELLNEFLDFESSCMERGIYISDKTRAEAEQFLKDGEVE